MRKLRNLLTCAAIAVLLCAVGLTFSACNGCGKTPEEQPPATRSKPTITVDTAALTGTVGESLTLPAATASDEVDGDISSQVKVNVYFDRDGSYVFPAVNAQAGTAGNVTNEFKPKKVGTYVVIYTVRNTGNQSARQEIELTVGESSAPRAPQLLTDQTEWTLDALGTKFDDEGNIVMSGNGDGVSLAYNGKKVKSGDIMTFRFSADMPTDPIFYFFGGPMSKSYDGDAPSNGEAGFPERLSLRIRSTNIEAWVANVGDKNMAFEFGTLEYSLLDGTDHVVSLRHTLDAEAQDRTITTEVWVDADTDGAASHTAVTKESDVKAFFGDSVFDSTPYLKDMFDAEKFGGWMNMGAWRAGLDTGTMCVKSATINGETPVLAPQLETSPLDKTYVVDQPFTIPAATAYDGNDYSDLTGRIKVTIVKPDGTREEPTGGGTSYTPSAFGKYQCIYSVADKSGNTAYAYYDFSVSKGKSDVKPTFDIVGDTSALTAAIGSPFTLPTVANVKDSFDDDISSLLEVKLTGCEAADLTGQASYTFYTAGKHTIVYSVTDYNDNTTEKTVEVTVGTKYTAVPLDAFSLVNTTRKEGDFIKLSDGSAAAPQKIYGEKVSVLVDLTLASTFGQGDGINWVCFNMRGGKHLNKVPGTEFLSFDWPSGLNFEVSESGIKINGAAHSDELGSWAPDVTGREFFAQGEKEIAWQVTDVYDDGRFVGVKVEMWIEGEKIHLNSTNKRDGEMFLTARAVAARPAILQSGWLQFYTHGEVDSGTYPDAKASHLRAMTIDGSKPKYLAVTLDPAETDVTVELGANYTLPTVSATFGDDNVTSDIKAYYLTSDQNADTFDYDSATALTGEPIKATAENRDGFKIVYRYGDKTVATVNVGVSAVVKNFTPAEGKTSLSVALGQTVTPPTVTYTLGAQQMDSDYTVRVHYPNTAIAETTVTTETSVKAELIRDFEFRYYYGVTLIGTIPVEVTGKPTGDQRGSADYNNDYKYIPTVKVYDEPQAIKFTKVNNSTVDIILREIVPHSTNSYMDRNWPAGLRIRMGGDGIKVGYNRDCNEKLLHVDTPLTNALHTLKWRVTDVFTQEVLSGIKVEVWVDGEKIAWKQNTEIISVERLADATANAENDYATRDTSYIFTPTYSAIIIHDSAITITEWYLDGTEPVRIVLPEQTQYSVDLGASFTLPDVKLVRGKEDITTELQAYYWQNDTAEPDYATATVLTGEPIEATAENIGGFKIVYRYGNKTLATVNVIVNAEVSDVTFSESSLSVAFGGTVTLPTVAFKLGAQTMDSGYTVKVYHPNTAIAEQEVSGSVKPEMARDFKLRYYYGATLLGEIPVTVTGDVSGNQSGNEKADGDYKYIDGCKVYDEKISIKFTKNNDSVVDIMLREIVPNKNGVWWDHNYPAGLRLRMGGDGLKVGYNRDCGAIRRYAAGVSNGEHTLTWRVTDVFADEKVSGVKVEVWLDGTKIQWDNGDSDVIDLARLQQAVDGSESEYSIHDTSYIFMPTNSAVIIHGPDGGPPAITITEWYLDGTDPTLA